MTNLDRIMILGRALYGSRWQRPVAAILCVDPKLVRKWTTGELQTPDRYVLALRTEAEKHISNVAETLYRTGTEQEYVD